MKRLVLACLVCIAAGLVIDRDPAGALKGYFIGRPDILRTVEPNLHSVTDRGIAYFAFGDFSALDSDTLRVSAAPWVLSSTLLALLRTDGDVEALSENTVREVFRQYGFHSPRHLANWPTSVPQPEMNYPLGMNVATGSRWVPPIAATLSNLGCASCHSSVTYDQSGLPQIDSIWLGGSNSSINLEAYTTALYESVLRFAGDDELLWRAVDRLHPDVGWREKLTLRFFVLPIMKKRVMEQRDSIGRLIPFRASLAGATNGLDSLQNRLGMIPEGTVLKTSIFNSVPELGGRVWRTAFLNTGNYPIPGDDPVRRISAPDIDDDHLLGLAGITAYFAVPSMGISPAMAEKHIPDTTAILHWLKQYRAQPFPGKIHESLLHKGQEIYSSACAECHGTYSESLDKPELVSFPNRNGGADTDSLRTQLFTQEIANRVNESVFGKYIDARPRPDYTAPPLSGIWSSAPYFHNGSVPTLWHLMNPELRPARFRVGGHRLDFELVGIAGTLHEDGTWEYPDGYVGWSESVVIDVSEPGLSTQGHENEFLGMTGDDKRALIEYLKLL